MPAITEDAAKQAAKIHSTMQQAVDEIRGNADLTDEGRTRQLATVYAKAREAMHTLRQEFEAERATTAKQLNREVFGYSADAGVDLMLVRDAADRVSRVTEPDEAVRLLEMAEDTGDEVLARAVAQHAHRNNVGLLGAAWGQVLGAYLEERPDMANRLEQLEGTQGGNFAAGVGNDPEAHFYLAAPTELERMPASAVDRYAVEAEPTPRETQAERNREIGKTIQQAQGGYGWLEHHQGLS